MTIAYENKPAVNYETISNSNKELWTPVYGDPDRDVQLCRLDEIAHHLQEAGVLNIDEEVAQTEQAVRRAFDEFLGKQEVEPRGSFAFIVPTRIQRKGNNKGDYTSEVDPLFELLKHVDNSTKQAVMSGMPPFVVDRYQTGQDGSAGAIIFAPVLMDIYRDVPLEKVQALTDKIMNQTTDFARDVIGADIAAFAAVLPRVIRFGEAIKTENFTTTTGHGATSVLINQTLEQAREKGLTRRQHSKIGILGTGAIGEATARILLYQEPTASIIMSDRNLERGAQIQNQLQGEFPNATITFTGDNAKVIESCEVTICAAAAQFNLDSEDLINVDLNGVFIIDDSQPGAFSPDQVRARGGEVVWPVGLDQTIGKLGTRLTFDYMNTGPAAFNEIYSCEAEVLALSISQEYDKAINGPVTTRQALAIGALMNQAGITIAPPQCLGRYINT